MYLGQSPVGVPGKAPQFPGKWKGHSFPEDLANVDSLLDPDHLWRLPLPPPPNPSAASTTPERLPEGRGRTYSTLSNSFTNHV